ncbi:MAG: hypothetical protein AAGA54_32490 [Myxococcota bacterium]
MTGQSKGWVLAVSVVLAVLSGCDAEERSEDMLEQDGVTVEDEDAQLLCDTCLDGSTRFPALKCEPETDCGTYRIVEGALCDSEEEAEVCDRRRASNLETIECTLTELRAGRSVTAVREREPSFTTARTRAFHHADGLIFISDVNYDDLSVTWSSPKVVEAPSFEACADLEQPAQQWTCIEDALEMAESLGNCAPGGSDAVAE